eukprot:ANDGO_03165.mRNA.1 hypothetical protein
MQTPAKLQIRASGDREIVMTRVFWATPSDVYEALTNPSLVSKWLLGPPAGTMPVCNIDFRIGGKYRYVWGSEDDPTSRMGVEGTYTRIEPPTHLVHTEKFDQAWYPGTAVISTALKEAGPSTTAFSATITYDSQEARDLVMKSDMEKGVAASYDRLDNLLANKQ